MTEELIQKLHGIARGVYDQDGMYLGFFVPLDTIVKELRAEQPATAARVPEPIHRISDVPYYIQHNPMGTERAAYRQGWNDCRDEMLSAPQPPEQEPCPQCEQWREDALRLKFMLENADIDFLEYGFALNGYGREEKRVRLFLQDLDNARRGGE